MQEDNNLPGQSAPKASIETAESKPIVRVGGEKVIQPTPGISQELAAQQQSAQTTQLAVTNNAVTHPTPATQPHAALSSPKPNDDSQMQVGMSASQLGLNHPKTNFFDFNPKTLIIKGLIILIGLSGVCAVLIFTNIIALSEFKTTDYVNSKGTHYSLIFYTKHTTGKVKSGNSQLISKVSKDGKLPITLSISSGNSSSFSRVENCSGFTKLFDVKNTSLNQTISVCDFRITASSASTRAAIYIAGFKSTDQVNIITIAQDYSGVDLSSPTGAQQSLSKFGMEPYQDDITKILESIKVN